MIAIFGGLVGCGAFFVVLIAVVLALVKKSQTDASAADIRAGHVGGLEDWTATSLAELSRNLVGTWYYQRALGGARRSSMTATIHSCRTRGELLRISAEKPQHGGGSITALTNWTRLDVTIGPSACQIWVNRVELGSLGLSSGRISDPRGAELGTYQRGPAASRLYLRGRDVAMVRSAREPETALPPMPEPFCTWVVPSPDEEATLWLTAIIAIEAGNIGMPTGGMVV